MITPTVHMNGTSAESLLEGYVAAGQAVRAALDALSATAPNARDYYVQPAGAFALAQSEHAARCEKLRIVLADLEALAESVS